MSVDLAEIISILPEIMCYIIPGYIACYLYYIYQPDYKDSCRQIKLFEASNIVISFLIKSVVDIFIPVVFKPYSTSICILIAVISGVIFARIVKSETMEKFMHRCFKSSPADTVWDAMNDPYCGSVIEVPVDGRIYQGYLVSYYPSNDDWWVVLEDYRVYANEHLIEAPDPIKTKDGKSLCPRIAIKVSDCHIFVSYLSEEVSKRR